MPYTTQWITTPAFTQHLPCVGYLLNTLKRYSDLSVYWLQQTVHTLLDAVRTSPSSTCAEGQKTAWGQGGGKSEVLAASLSPGICLSGAPSCLVFSCHLGVCENGVLLPLSQSSHWLITCPRSRIRGGRSYLLVRVCPNLPLSFCFHVGCLFKGQTACKWFINRSHLQNNLLKRAV